MALLYQRETLLGRSLRCALGAELDVILCLSQRASDDAVAASVSQIPVRVLRCARAEEGMGSTLAEGIFSCAGYPGAFVALADMPFLDPGTYRELERHYARERICVPIHEGRRGHPVLFDASFFAELGQLSGDRGAACLLQRHAQHCVEVASDDPGIHGDVDHPGDLPGD